jgi:hypothetical protein
MSLYWRLVHNSEKFQGAIVKHKIYLQNTFSIPAGLILHTLTMSLAVSDVGRRKSNTL